MAADLVAKIKERLRAYLAADAALVSQGVQVLGDWPDPQTPLPEKAVSISVPDQSPPEVKYWPPQEFDFLPDPGGNPNAGLARYSYGGVRCNIQLDVWARFGAIRAEILGSLQAALHRHPNLTITPANDSWPRFARWPELVLADSTLFGVVWLYQFDALAPPVETGPARQGGEFRAVLLGAVEGYITDEETVAAVRTLTVDSNVRTADTPADPALTETITAIP